MYVSTDLVPILLRSSQKCRCFFLFQVLNDQKAEGILIDALDEVDDAMKEAERRAFEEECERLCESLNNLVIQTQFLQSEAFANSFTWATIPIVRSLYNHGKGLKIV